LIFAVAFGVAALHVAAPVLTGNLHVLEAGVCGALSGGKLKNGTLPFLVSRMFADYRNSPNKNAIL
jgi:hypothetical protein